jgi:hypothetical protein
MTDPTAARGNWLDWLRKDRAQRASQDATRASLLRLAKACLDAHVAAAAADMVPRDPEGGSKPLAAAVACYETIVKRRV